MMRADDRAAGEAMRGLWVALALVLSIFALSSAKADAQAPTGADAPGSVLRDCADCPEMVVVPPGHFLMGASAAEEESEGVPERARAHSQPITEITLARPFAIGRFSVTRGEFAAFVGATRRRIDDGCFTLSSTRDPPVQFDDARNWLSPGFAQTDRHPAVCVSRADAEDYAVWLAQRTGAPYRLPSEAEWEYAARAGTTSARYVDDAQNEICEYANVADRTFLRAMNYGVDPHFNFACADGNVYTAPVGSYRPNAFGVYDMLGNVWQWVADCRTLGYQGRPTDASAWREGDCTRGVVRGGSWYAAPWSVRLGYRGSNNPGDRDSNIGFRVARDLETH
jgi:formylglycine-generating enzyme required for sulfatase activity